MAMVMNVNAADSRVDKTTECFLKFNLVNSSSTDLD